MSWIHRDYAWNRCQVCGRMIGFDAFADGSAVHKLIAPSSEFSDESWDTYHVACDSPTAQSQESTAPASPTSPSVTGAQSAPTT